MTQQAKTTAPRQRNGLGTFGGVFTPSILTILGVIMYLRFGWVVGNAGLTGAFAIVTIATAITFLTGLSISQIATDQRIKTGGAYYMISRALGIEVGGAIGIPLYLAQALSVALYTIGFAESLTVVFPILDQRLVAAGTTIAVTGLALISARTAIRVQYFIMGGIVLSLLSFFFGSSVAETSPSLPFERVGFWQVFAVFFPAVTGIMAGVNLSGDLEDPRRSIPRGTMAAIGVSYVIYMIIPVFLWSRASPEALVSDPLIMRRIAIWGDAILVGVWGATLSSALGSILGAPRILQALAKDNILPKRLRVLGNGSGPEDEPRLGTYVSLGIALVAVALGDLNVIAPILTMFFLATYTVVNVVSAVERFLRSPSFRPTFRVHWALSLSGAVGCGTVMFLINPIASVVAAAIVLGIYLWLQSRGLKTAWGDVRQGAWQALVRWGLLNVRAAEDAKNWRPNFLVLAGSPAKRWYLIDFANSVSHDRGILSVATIIPESTSTERKDQLAATIRRNLEERSVEALVRVVSAPNPYVGVSTLVEAYGLGSLVPNTVLLGDGMTTKDPAEYGMMVARIHRANRSVVIVRAETEHGFGDRSSIDVWLHGIRGNGALMITLAHLLATSLDWMGARITVRMIVANPEGADEAEANLRRLIDASRIEAAVEVIVDTRPPTVVISEASRHTDLTFLGLAAPGSAERALFTEQLGELVEQTRSISTVAYVLASAEANIENILA